MSLFFTTSPDGRMTFVCPDDIFSRALTLLKKSAYHRGAYRTDKLGYLSLPNMRKFIRNEIEHFGWDKTGSLGQDLMTRRYLEFSGYSNATLNEDGATFTAGVMLGGFSTFKKVFPLPVWLQFFLGQEKMTNRAGLTNQALLSTCDSTRILYDHWLDSQNLISAERIMEGAITSPKIQSGSVTQDNYALRADAITAEPADFDVNITTTIPAEEIRVHTPPVIT